MMEPLCLPVFSNIKAVLANLAAAECGDQICQNLFLIYLCVSSCLRGKMILFLKIHLGNYEYQFTATGN